MFTVLSDGKIDINYDEKTPFTIKLIQTNAKNNNNKFYNLTWDGSYCTAVYGRVGATGTQVSIGSSLSSMQSQANKKIAKGYKVLQTVDAPIASSNSNLSDVAKRDLIDENDENKDKLFSLIDFLVENNRHRIAQFSGGKITIDDDGLIKTELGVVTEETINKAEKHLQKISKLFNKNNLDDADFINNINAYLMLIPQKVGARKGWHVDLFGTEDKIKEQFDFLEQLRSSIALYEQKVAESKEKDNKENQPIEKLFERKVRLVTDKKVIQSIQKMFDETKSDSHTSSKLKLLNVYELVHENKAFDEESQRIGNVKRFWHGTRNFNLLSILKNGLLLPRANNGLNIQITGAMFGDGVYFSNQSTKSLNYSNGFWGGSGHDNHCFMFVADVAMGKEFHAFHPKAKMEAKKCGSDSRGVYPVNGYDSVYAKGQVDNMTNDGRVGWLRNDEMIVFRLNQINLKYLCEFGL